MALLYFMSSEDAAILIWSQSDAPSTSKTLFFFFVFISVFMLKRVFPHVRDNRFSRWLFGFPKYGHIFTNPTWKLKNLEQGYADYDLL